MREMTIKNFMCVIAVVFAGALTSGCGDVCDDAADVCGGDTAEGGGECSGAGECTAECIVDQDTCDFSDPELEACISACLGGT